MGPEEKSNMCWMRSSPQEAQLAKNKTANVTWIGTGSYLREGRNQIAAFVPEGLARPFTSQCAPDPMIGFGKGRGMDGTMWWLSYSHPL